MIKLDIGCGHQKHDVTWIGVDPYAGGDVVAFAHDLPYDDNSVDMIYSSHALEHVCKSMVVPTLKEWARVIKPGGSIEIRVPDLAWCCENWLKHRTNDWHMDVLFGNQEHVPGEIHKTGFTPQIMAQYLDKAGLKLLEQFDIESHSQNTLVFKVTK